MLKKILKAFRRTRSQCAALLPLNAIYLSACGSGGEEKQDLTTIKGSVLKGQITNALVFSDVNLNGIFDTSEPSTFTDTKGNFILSTSNDSANLIALGQVASIDMSSGASAESIEFFGPSYGTVISPFSTVIIETGISTQQLARSLGLGNIDLLNFHPFTEGVDAAEALLVENTSHQLENVINSFTEAAKGSGLTAEQAKKTALNSLVAVAKEKLALKETLNLSDDFDIAAISKNVTRSMTLTEDQAEPWKAKIDDVSTALKNVNTEIKNVADLTSDTTKGVFSLGQLLKDQIADSFSEGTNINLEDRSEVSIAAMNLAPSKISITSSTITENATDLKVGTFIANDEYPMSLVYSLAGRDAIKFKLSESGELSLKSSANFELQSNYSLVLKVEDIGGKKSAAVIQVDVENVNDTPIGSIQIKGSAERLEVLEADITQIMDEDSPNLASIAEYQWLRDGKEIVDATSEELTLSQADVGKLISVSISYTDGSGYREKITSKSTDQVAQVESIGAVSLHNLGSSKEPILNFYLDRPISEKQSTVSSIDFVLKFKPDQVGFENFQSNSEFTGVVNLENSAEGHLIYAGYSVIGVPSLEPLFTVTMQDLDENAKFDIIIDDLLINNESLDGSTFLIG